MSLPISPPMSVPFRRLGLALSITVFTTALLTACGGSSDDLGATPAAGTGTGTEDHENTHIDTAGRLAILEDGSKAVRIFDLDGNTVNATFTTTHVPSAIVAGPGGRHAVVMQNTGGQTEFIDSGIWQEDHGDHLHDYMEAPRKLEFTVTGPRPSHYQSHEGVGALFMDGLADTGQPATVQTLTEAGLNAGRAEATLALAAPVHGAAEPRGDHLLVTVRDDQSTGTLPDLVDVYRRSGTSLVRVQGFDLRCPSLHGSSSTTTHTVFGCLDGVLVIAQNGDTFTASKIAAPASMPTGARISTVVGHAARSTLIGLAAPGLLFEIDPAAGTIRPLPWTDGRTRRAHAFDAEGRRFLVLDDLGTVHVLDSSAQWAVTASLPVVRSMPSASPFPSLAAGATTEVYLSDPAGRQLSLIDLAGPTLARQIALDFTPTGLAWFGLREHSH